MMASEYDWYRSAEQRAAGEKYPVCVVVGVIAGEVH
jgi:hypothetical protein